MSHRASRPVLAVAATLVAGAALLAAAPRSSARTAPSTLRAAVVDTVLTASLSGKAEPGNTGDTNASGSATVTVEPSKDRVCYTVTETGLADVTGAHIHHAAEGKDGPPVVMLDAPTSGSSEGCAAATASIMKEIVANPADFYVNVHDKAHPAGAIRGQLMAKGMGM